MYGLFGCVREDRGRCGSLGRAYWSVDWLGPHVLNVLVENYNIAPISTPEADLAELLG